MKLSHTLLNYAPCLYGRELLLLIKTILLVSICVAAAQYHFDLLVVDKVAIQDGEYWRLLSGHFTHSSFSHAFWDILAFSASVVWLSIYSIRAVAGAIVAGMVTVNILLMSHLSPLTYYCGLSGVLFSPLIVASYLHAKHHKNIISAAPLLMIIVKLIIDVISQNTLLVTNSWPAYPEAHIAGAIAGGLIIMAIEWLAAVTWRQPTST